MAKRSLNRDEEIDSAMPAEPVERRVQFTGRSHLLNSRAFSLTSNISLPHGEPENNHRHHEAKML